jgi:hypothetical protein
MPRTSQEEINKLSDVFGSAAPTLGHAGVLGQRTRVRCRFPTVIG